MPLAHSAHFPVCLGRANGISTQRYRWIQAIGSAGGQFSHFLPHIPCASRDTISGFTHSYPGLASLSDAESAVVFS